MIIKRRSSEKLKIGRKTERRGGKKKKQYTMRTSDISPVTDPL